MIKFFVAMLLFGLNLEPVEFAKIDKAVIIVCDNLYCKDCLEDIASLRHVWSPDYKTVIITKSIKNKQSAIMLSKLFESKIKYDSIFFKETKHRLGFDRFEIAGYLIENTPAIIVTDPKGIRYLSFKEMFQDIPKDTFKLKELILSTINQQSETKR
jgi:hypothetical protein